MGYKNIIIGIYKIYFANSDKVYIGLTKNFLNRKSNHLLKLSKGKHYNIHLQRAYNLYGKDNIKIDLIEECELQSLKDREKFYVTKFDSMNNGYNLTTGGEMCQVSDEVKKKISIKHIGKVVKDETKDKLRLANLGKKVTDEEKKRKSEFIKKNPFTEQQKLKMSESASYKRSDETKKRMSEARIGFKPSVESKNKLIIHNLKKKRPNSIFEIINDKVFVDNYEYKKHSKLGYMTPPELELYHKKRKEDILAKRLLNKGKKRSPCSEQTKTKISQANKGKKRSKEYVLKMIHHLKTMKRSETFKQKMINYYKRNEELNM